MAKKVESGENSHVENLSVENPDTQVQAVEVSVGVPAVSISTNPVTGAVSASVNLPVPPSGSMGAEPPGGTGAEPPVIMGDDDSIANKFRGIPISELIAAPLTAACDAQMLLAAAAYKYMTQIGFSTDDQGKVDFSKPNLLKFQLQRPVETKDSITTSTIEVQAPFLGLVPIPSLLIDDVNISFQMEVSDTKTTKDSLGTDTTVEVTAGFSIPFMKVGHISVNGHVSTNRENTRSTNQTAKYNVNVSAKQQPQTEGMSKLMDILASCTAPLSIKDSGGDSGGGGGKG